MEKRKLCCEPAWVDVGQMVWVPWNRENLSAIRCIVTMAAGNHARVENEKYNFSRLLPLSSLRVYHDDPRARHGALADLGDFFGDRPESADARVEAP
jgi:hypothetical protein